MRPVAYRAGRLPVLDAIEPDQMRRIGLEVALQEVGPNRYNAVGIDRFVYGIGASNMKAANASFFHAQVDIPDLLAAAKVYALVTARITGGGDRPGQA